MLVFYSILANIKNTICLHFIFKLNFILQKKKLGKLNYKKFLHQILLIKSSFHLARFDFFCFNNTLEKTSNKILRTYLNIKWFCTMTKFIAYLHAFFSFTQKRTKYRPECQIRLKRQTWILVNITFIFCKF